MAELPVRESKQVDRETLDTMVTNFIETVGNLYALEFVSTDEQAQAVEHIGRRLRDEFCAGGMRGYAMLANQILTIATTRMA